MQKIIFSILILVVLSGEIFSQIVIENKVETIAKFRIKKISYFQTKISDTTTYHETIRLVQFFDTLGRCDSLLDFHKNKLVGTYTNYYLGNSTECFRQTFVNPARKLIFVDSSEYGPGDRYLLCQKIDFSSSKQFKTIFNFNGLPSIIIDYGRIKCKDGDNGWNCIHDYYGKPEVIIRLDYQYY